MQLTKRQTLVMGVGAASALLLPTFASAALIDEAVAEFTGGANVSDGGVKFTAPEIAENGNTVPVSVSAPGAVAISILAPENPNAEVITFNFGPLSGARTASTRIRLAKTQEVIAIAKMEDGSFHRATKIVKVTIGGCGG